jgi:hypothetical protein
MYTFEQLLQAASNTKTPMFRMAFDIIGSSLVNVIKRKCKTKITLEQANQLNAAAEAACKLHNSKV